ncbi:MAG: hypothetical protein ACJ77A_03235 [Actinomycetota bacterium]
MRSRIKIASVAAVAVLVAAAMFHESRRADATQNQPVVAGQINTELGATSICWMAGGATCTIDNTGFFVRTDLANVGVMGRTDTLNGIGVDGESGKTGATGVYGNGTYAVHGKSFDGWGVWGEGLDRGVYGISDNEGVVGFGNNVGIRAESPNIALRVKGKAEFSRSGKVTISYPNKQATVTGVPVTAKSLAFATLQQFLAGRYVLAAVPNLGGSSNSFTIYLNKAPGSSSAPKSVVVGWHVIERP